MRGSGAESDVLFVWGTRSVGGAERRLTEAAGHLRSRGTVVTHFILAKPEASWNESQLESLIKKEDGGDIAIGGVRALAAQIGSRNPCHIVASGMKPSLITRAIRALAMFRGSKFSLTMPRSGLDYTRGRLYRAMDRLTSGLIDRYVVNSNCVASYLESYGIRPTKITVLGSALPSEWLLPVSGSWREMQVLMVGNDRPEKNHEFGLEVFLATDIEATLVVYTNDGSALKDKWSRLSTRRIAGKRLIIHEGESVKPESYENVRVLLHPSLSESVPRVVLEAQARGCLVIASNAGQTADYVLNGACLEPTLVNEWSEQLGDALRNYESAEKKALPFQSVEEYADLFWELLESSTHG